MGQTPVEWLIDEAMGLVIRYMNGTLNEKTLDDDIYKIGTKAKEMEKERMSNAMLHGWRSALDEEVHSIDPNDFYNKTFKSE